MFGLCYLFKLNLYNLLTNFYIKIKYLPKNNNNKNYVNMFIIHLSTLHNLIINPANFPFARAVDAVANVCMFL